VTTTAAARPGWPDDAVERCETEIAGREECRWWSVGGGVLVVFVERIASFAGLAATYSSES
jgi:hypothetical protein